VKTIVLGYDDTRGARRALERTAELARAFHASVVVVSVAPVLEPAGPGIGLTDSVEPLELHEEELAHARQLLTEHGVSAEYELAVGNPAKRIVEIADQRRADLVVVGREDGFLGRILGDSVSGAVERHAHCDVLVVH
jgi:nucleotide-binding universal stress UspA family protein